MSDLKDLEFKAEVLGPDSCLPETAKRYQELIPKYGKNRLVILALPLDDNEYEFLEVICSKPGREASGRYFSMHKTDFLRACDTLVKDCLLTHKEQVMEDDALFYTCAIGMNPYLPFRAAKVKKYSKLNTESKKTKS